MPRVGFVFDIDGVLYRLSAGGSKEAVPGAEEALTLLQEHGVPHVFMSNGTGQTEAQKAGTLAKLFGCPVKSEDVVLASTPMREEAKEKRKLVVSASPETSHAVAAAYGWENYIVFEDYARLYPVLHPVRDYAPETASRADAEHARDPIGAVMVVQSPRDWYEGLQVLSDVLRSRTGVPGAENELAPGEPQAVELHFGNPDFDYAARHDVPRYTLGAFRACLETLFARSTGRELEHRLHGKPSDDIFAFAESQLLGKDSGVEEIYMVGDNPKSDIMGANARGGKWRSVLVRTGCFRGEGNDKEHPAWRVYDSALDAVRDIIRHHNNEE